jgi:hypothetical protein
LLRYFEKFDAPRIAWPLRALVHLGAWMRLCAVIVRTLLTRRRPSP